jgi:hypothetical protein
MCRRSPAAHACPERVQKEIRYQSFMYSESEKEERFCLDYFGSGELLFGCEKNPDKPCRFGQAVMKVGLPTFILKSVV